MRLNKLVIFVASWVFFFFFFMNFWEVFKYDEGFEMLDGEDGELVEHNSHNDLGQQNVGDMDINNQEFQNKNRKRRAIKKKNKQKMSDLGHNVTYINRLLN